MENHKNVKVFLGTTKFKAGIFLSGKIAERKPYFKALKLESFDSVEEAEAVLRDRYGDAIGDAKIKLNVLHQIRDERAYSVFWTKQVVGITYTNNYSDNFNVLLPDNDQFVWWRHHLTYQDAQHFAASRFCEVWQNPELYIIECIPVNRPVRLAEIKYNCNGK